MNKAILMGRLTKDPEIRMSQSGSESISIARYTLAVDRRGKKEEREADFISCVAFGKTGEFISQYFSKGSFIELSGRLQTGSYEKDGVKHYTTDVVVEEAGFGGSKKTDGSSSSVPAPSLPADADDEEIKLPLD